MEEKIVDDIKKLDDEFIEKKMELIRKFVKSKLEYWQKIPVLHHVYKEHDDQLSDYIIKNKVYPISTLSYNMFNSSGVCCINCRNAEFVYLDKELNAFISIDNNYEVKKSLSFNMYDRDLRIIDAEVISAKYLKSDFENRKPKPEQVEMWIMQAIMYEISITLEDFKNHFGDNFGYGEDSFEVLYNDCMTKLAGHLLLRQ